MQTKHAQQNQDLHARRIKLSGMSLVNIPTHLITKFISLLINIPVMNAIWQERRELERLTIEHMRDIGLDPIRVQQECKRSFFDIPAERKRLVHIVEQESFRREF